MILYKNDKVIFDTGCGMKIYKMNGLTYACPTVTHAHEYVQIWFVSKGVCEHKISGRVSHLRPGQFFIVPPLIEHEVKIINDSLIYGIDFPLELISEDNLINKDDRTDARIKEDCSDFMKNLLSVQGKYKVSERIGVRLESTIKKMFEIYLKRPQFCALELKSYLFQLLTYMFRAVEEGSDDSEYIDAHHEAIDEVLLYTVEHLSEKLYLSDMAQHAQMSVTSFNVYFKKYAGKTFVEYVNYLRIEKAQTFLLETSLDISEIGDKVGIGDLSYFNRIFKRIVGVSPGSFRKLYRTET